MTFLVLVLNSFWYWLAPSQPGAGRNFKTMVPPPPSPLFCQGIFYTINGMPNIIKGLGDAKITLFISIKWIWNFHGLEALDAIHEIALEESLTITSASLESLMPTCLENIQKEHNPHWEGPLQSRQTRLSFGSSVKGRSKLPISCPANHSPCSLPNHRK